MPHASIMITTPIMGDFLLAPRGSDIPIPRTPAQGGLANTSSEEPQNTPLGRHIAFEIPSPAPCFAEGEEEEEDGDDENGGTNTGTEGEEEEEEEEDGDDDDEGEEDEDEDEDEEGEEEEEEDGDDDEDEEEEGIKLELLEPAGEVQGAPPHAAAVAGERALP